MTPERLRELIAANLDALEAILRWNAAHGIQVFRITSNLIPFASHRVNGLRWWEDFRERFEEVGALMSEEGMRLSTHPGQYTVLGSPRARVTEASLAELEYHSRLLSVFGLDAEHKIVLHLGGAYGDPDSALARVAGACERLSDDARARLVFENDERWSLEEVLALGQRLEVPVVLDVFHQELNPSLGSLGVRELVLAAGEKWRPADGRQEVHFSTQEPGLRPGAHARTLDETAFARFVSEVGDLPLDCIVEVKDKEQSALRAQRLVAAVARS